MCFFAVSMRASRPFLDHVGYLFVGCGFLIAFAIGAGIANSVVRQRRLDRRGCARVHDAASPANVLPVDLISHGCEPLVV